MEITFVRHAQSEANVSGHWQGQGDSPLSAEGRHQAERLAARLAGAAFDRIVASDLSRTADTARALGRPVQLEAAWREVHVGAWEGLTREEVFERFADEVQALARGEDIAIGGGESWSDVLARARAALDRLRAEIGPGGRALVVTHGGVIHVLLSSLMGLTDRRPRPIGRVGNTAMTTVRFDGGVCELATFNDQGHLGSLGHWAAERLEAGDPVIALVESEEAAGALDLPLAETAGEDLTAALERAAAAHPGRRVALVGAPEAVGRYATTLFGHRERGPARVAPPGPGGRCHVVWSRRGATFADYNAL